MKNNLLETLTGFFVLILAALFFIFAYNRSSISKVGDTYSVFANFENVEGINEGSEVMIAGVKVGYIKCITLDPEEYMASLKLKIDNDIKIPVDSKASIVSSGFLGGKFISISPGQSEEYLKAKDKIMYTQPSVNLESMIGKFMYSTGNKSSGSETSGNSAHGEKPNNTEVSSKQDSNTDKNNTDKNPGANK